ncbi:protein kinase [Actinomadura sp. J1-007]|nr:protein kinase [Actinomadura sp. J1-007]MWK37795.1 protein kinase [Actinomadura sp. J1-007]
MQVADAVADAHRLGVIHRDIKPANLLFTRFRRVALADFGIAVLPGVDLSVTHSMTLLYAAPEVLRGGVGEQVCDVYSLGVTLYELLAGRTPHDPGHNLPIRALIDELLRLQEGPVPDIPGVHPSFMAVIRTALHTDPGRRYQHAGQMQDALARVIV